MMRDVNFHDGKIKIKISDNVDLVLTLTDEQFKQYADAIKRAYNLDYGV
mgnify:CR=1 FL=1